jgi:hypothetical protein
MKRVLRLLAFGLLLCGSLAGHAAQNSRASPPPKRPAWAQLSVEQQKILAPIASEWDKLPDAQRRRLLAAAKQYPTLTPQQQQRFTARLPEWSQLSLEQRRLARERYKKFRSLPPEQQAAIRQQWEEEQARKAPPQPPVASEPAGTAPAEGQEPEPSSEQ